MTDLIKSADTIAIAACIIGLLLCIIALRLGSIARSLKKIEQSKTEVELKIPDDMIHNVGNIAWEAGRNFQHGMRTDR